MKNKDLINKTDLSNMLEHNNYFMVGNEQYWNIVDKDGKKVIDHDFKSLAELNGWAIKQKALEADSELEKSGQSKLGGLQLGLL
jgi:hypothetical protein